MKNLKSSRVLTVTLMLVLVASTFSFADQPLNNPKRSDLRIISIVEKYSPETLEEWKQVLKERRDLKEKFLKSHHSKKSIIDSKKPFNKRKNEYINHLRTKVEAGEITQEEARKRFEEYKSKCKGKHGSYKESLRERITIKKELIKAVSENDQTKVKTLLEKLYASYKESNKRMKEQSEKF